MINERAFIAQFYSATPQEMIDMVLHADADEQRVLQIYLGQQQFDDIRAMGMQTRVCLLPLRPHHRQRVVLHGIMGGELTQFLGGRQVANLAECASPHGRPVRSPPGQGRRPSALDVRASGILARYYAKQIVWLSQEWNVRTFFFDWRIDIRKSADALFQSIQPVVWHRNHRCISSRTPWEDWSAAATSFAIPTAGAKAEGLSCWALRTYGSFAIPRLLFGANDILETIAKLDLKHNARDLLHIAKTFPWRLPDASRARQTSVDSILFIKLRPTPSTRSARLCSIRPRPSRKRSPT